MSMRTIKDKGFHSLGKSGYMREF